MSKVSIIEFQDQYAQHFAQLNFEWLEKYFYIEAYDRVVLNHPQEHILNQGGQILFALLDDLVVGTVALIKQEGSVYELSKMAVNEKFQGLRIGQKLMYAAIYKAITLNTDRLFLDSNTLLKPAIGLYKKVGFREIPIENGSAYERCNIRMELNL